MFNTQRLRQTVAGSSFACCAQAAHPLPAVVHFVIGSLDCAAQFLERRRTPTHWIPRSAFALRLSETNGVVGGGLRKRRPGRGGPKDCTETGCLSARPFFRLRKCEGCERT